MSHTLLRVSIPCEDNDETLVFDRTVWGKNDEMLEFSIMDSYIGKCEYSGILGRFRRAWYAFNAKPIYYTGIMVSEKELVRAFLTECLTVLDTEVGEDKNNQGNSFEQKTQQ